jgi:DNA-binding transcriptional MocR family regulator
MRVWTMIQFFSQVWPSSGEKSCSQRAEVFVMLDHVKRTRIGRPSSSWRPSKTPTPFHAVADLDGVDAVRVSREAATRGAEATPLSAYFVGRARAVNSLVLGFGAVRPDAASRGMERLAAAIAAASRS